jgi:hypothetical protein
MKIKATDNEIYEVLVKNPPQILMQNEAFQTDGRSIPEISKCNQQPAGQ